jgi:hypothetical protein
VRRHEGRDIIKTVSFLVSSTIGFFLGFVFGVGCALAVMYSIFLGGYRAAVRDAELSVPPDRLLKARAKLVTANMPTPL